MIEDAWKEAEREAQKEWQKYIPLYNRLEMWPCSHGYDDEEGRNALDIECEAVKAKYDMLHEEVGRLYTIWRQEVANVSGLMYFDISLLQTISFRIKRIAIVIISNIDNLKKKGIV